MENKKNASFYVLYVSSFPPRACGIATFTKDLADSFDETYGPAVSSKIIALNSDETVSYQYPDAVIGQIAKNTLEDYIRAAEIANSDSRIRIINIQHEFGLFGGVYGSHLFEFVERVTKPVVITFHTILPNPDPDLRAVVQRLYRAAKQIIVMTESSRNILHCEYGLELKNISVIPHGIHPTLYVSPRKAKRVFGYEGKIILSSFGLLSRGKGIEYVLDALPPLIGRFPNIHYVIIGVTHPVVLREEGEAYRDFLMQKVHDLGLSKHVEFHNEYVSVKRLLQFLTATDIYIASSLNPHQAVSGTLSYALGVGRPVISTSFGQAREYVTPDVGILVGFRDSDAYGRALNSLLSSEEKRIAFGRDAFYKTRKTTWFNVALALGKLYGDVDPALAGARKKAPAIRLDHLLRLTDQFGIIQFADLHEPQYSSGYTVDDNARALMVAALHYRMTSSPLSLKLVSTYLSFLEYTADADGYFHNYVSYDRRHNETLNANENLEDANARALMAVAFISTLSCLPKKFRQRALGLFERCFRNDIYFDSPRAAAFFCKALCFLSQKWEDPARHRALKIHADFLMRLFTARTKDGKEWFEDTLTYSNALLPDALLSAYRATGDTAYQRAGNVTLDFLISKTFIDGHYVPIGQRGWYCLGKERPFFDQQPEDVCAMIGALHTMTSITHDSKYADLLEMAFFWYLGDNSINLTCYNRVSGGCYDGVREDGTNLNQGAESTVSYLHARLLFETMQTPARDV
ncbi:MAG: glycosyltransferase [Candidatus Uhrbacteria bacterium]|nr:glycosyltransferase [Candidatus Uhrbacteria bacterium]